MEGPRIPSPYTDRLLYIPHCTTPHRAVAGSNLPHGHYSPRIRCPSRRYAQPHSHSIPISHSHPPPPFPIPTLSPPLCDAMTTAAAHWMYVCTGTGCLGFPLPVLYRAVQSPASIHARTVPTVRTHHHHHPYLSDKILY